MSNGHADRSSDDVDQCKENENHKGAASGRIVSADHEKDDDDVKKKTNEMAKQIEPKRCFFEVKQAIGPREDQ